MLGIFDSGLGGLTVVRAIERALPEVGYIYLGDTARLPYGTKSAETIARYALQALDFLRLSGATIPIIACHTVSSVFATNPKLRQQATALFDGQAPLDVLTPALAAAASATRNGRIGVLATTATIRSRVYERALRKFRVVPVAASILVAFAEERWVEGRGRRRALRSVLREVLQPFTRSSVDTVVLACTHFPILKPEIRAILKPSVRIIDPGEELAAALRAIPIGRMSQRRRFFATDIPSDFSDRASRFLGRPITAQLTML